LSGVEESEARLNIFVRLVGLIFLLLGVILTYLTSTTPLLPQVASVFYIVSALLLVSGLIATVAKLE